MRLEQEIETKKCEVQFDLYLGLRNICDYLESQSSSVALIHDGAQLSIFTRIKSDLRVFSEDLRSALPVDGIPGSVDQNSLVLPYLQSQSFPEFK